MLFLVLLCHSAMHVHTHIHWPKTGADKQQKKNPHHQHIAVRHRWTLSVRQRKALQHPRAMDSGCNKTLSAIKATQPHHPKKLLVKPQSTRCTPKCSLRQAQLSILPPNTLFPWLPKHSDCVSKLRSEQWLTIMRTRPLKEPWDHWSHTVVPLRNKMLHS